MNAQITFATTLYCEWRLNIASQLYLWRTEKHQHPATENATDFITLKSHHLVQRWSHFVLSFNRNPPSKFIFTSHDRFHKRCQQNAGPCFKGIIPFLKTKYIKQTSKKKKWKQGPTSSVRRSNWVFPVSFCYFPRYFANHFFVTNEILHKMAKILQVPSINNLNYKSLQWTHIYKPEHGCTRILLSSR